MTTNNETYISRQIAVYKTDKKLVELIDKLNPAPMEYYAHMHAQGDDIPDSDRRMYSNIGMTLLDYSAGTGDNTKRAEANLTPDEVQYIFSRCEACMPTFEFKTDKIFGKPDEHGRAKVVKLVIRRATVGSDGKPRKYPWYIEIENGSGVPQKTAVGGTYCQSGSFQSEVKIFANMSDLDFYKLFNRANCFIEMFEMATAPALLRLAKQQMTTNSLENK